MVKHCKFIAIILVVLSVSALGSGFVCASDSEKVILGKWTGKAPNGDKITYVFKQDNVVLWTVDAADYPGTVSAKYVIDDTTKPIHIDIFEFSHPSLNRFTFLGIIQFNETNKMILDGRPVQGKGTRLESFSKDAIEFSKSR